MITISDGDMIKSDVSCIAIPVNCVGVAGKGLALWMKLTYPDIYESYRRHCKSGRFNINNLLFYKKEDRSVLLVPTKRHWKQPSRLEDVEAILRRLSDVLDNLPIKNIGLPMLGCGVNTGTLNPDDVLELMQYQLKDVKCDVFIYYQRQKLPTT